MFRDMENQCGCVWASVDWRRLHETDCNRLELSHNDEWAGT